jgi:hypothetical protein
MPSKERIQNYCREKLAGSGLYSRKEISCGTDSSNPLRSASDSAVFGTLGKNQQKARMWRDFAPGSTEEMPAATQIATFEDISPLVFSAVRDVKLVAFQPLNQPLRNLLC